MTAARWVGYLRSAITLLGLFRVEANQPVDFEPALKRAVFFRGTTLEFALIRAADAFLLWGDPRTAATLISRAAEENSTDRDSRNNISETCPGCWTTARRWVITMI
jgi:hypothetical protein